MLPLPPVDPNQLTAQPRSGCAPGRRRRNRAGAHWRFKPSATGLTYADGMVRPRVWLSVGLAGCAVLLGSGRAHAQAIAHNRCPIDMYERAESSLVDVVGSWPSLLKHHTTFASCDDGALAEGYSDAVVTMFAMRWDQFRVFVTLSRRHPAFRSWAIGHIDATAADDHLKKIALNAATCIDDVTTRSLCRTIEQAAADALTEQKQLRHK